MENEVNQSKRNDRRLFWIVFFGALAASVVIEVLEGLIDYMM